jgi:glycosyltransferase involved in cell wall biosynthesis
MTMVSVIIATHNSENLLTPTLAALVPGAATGRVREVIVADAGSTDGTAEIADIAGCELLVERGPLAPRLRAAVARARSPWLMFLRAGVVLDPAWLEETGRFIQQMELRGLADARAAMFRRSQAFDPAGSLLQELIAVLRAALARPRPEQGVLINKRLYDELGGHRDAAADPEADLIARLGRRRTVLLRSGAITAHQI